MAVQLPKKEAEVENSWRETRNLHPLDQRLRRNGFRIHSRPKRGEAVWSLSGSLFTESEALSLCTDRGPK